jgi:hypothetical protein
VDAICPPKQGYSTPPAQSKNGSIKTMIKVQTLILRIFGVFGSSALAAVAGGAIFGVELWKSAAIAGVVAAGKVTEALLRSWSEDGTLTKEEVAAAFGKKA